MKKLTSNIFLQLIFIQYSCGRPSMDERIERVFDITQGDRVNIDLAERVGVAHLAVSYPQGINCTLMKTVIEEPFRLCRNVSIPVCKTVQKVRMTNITEDCSQKAEYCQYNFRTQEVTQQTIICQRPTEMICDDSCTEECQTSCERNPIVVCNTVPQTVAITEKKQRCGPEKSLQTTKICFTYPDASWVCKEPRETLDCDKEGVRLVAHEVAMPRIECQEKEMEPLCIPENCLLKNSNTDCLTTDIPTEVKLEDQVCEICQEGRTKLRPVVVQEEECDTSSTQEFCSEGIEDSSKWTKTCSVPRSLRDDVLQEVLENTRDEFNEIPDVKNQGQNNGIQESKIIRMKLPLQIQRQGTDSQSTIEGADIFFAKQFFQNDLVRRGKGDNEVLVHTNNIENKSDEKEDLVNVPFVIQKETETPRLTMKVNFQFDVPSSSPRPTGIPYVYSDNAVPFTKRPTPSESFNARFGKRPTPQMVTEPSYTTNNDRAVGAFKKTTEKPDDSDIDSILDLIISDRDFNLALPLPSNIQPTETYSLLNPRIETLDNKEKNYKESRQDPIPRFPFLEWQNNGSGFNTQSQNGGHVTNRKNDFPRREHFNTFPRNYQADNEDNPFLNNEFPGAKIDPEQPIQDGLATSRNNDLPRREQSNTPPRTSQTENEDKTLFNNEFSGPNIISNHPIQSDVRPFSNTENPNSNTHRITEESETHPNQLQFAGSKYRLNVNVNGRSEVKDIPSNSKDLVKSNDYKFIPNIDSSFPDKTKVEPVSKDLGISNRQNYNSGQVNTLNDSNKDLDPKSQIKSPDKKLQPYGTSLQTPDLNILRSKEEIADSVSVPKSDQTASVIGIATNKKEGVEPYQVGSRFSPGNRKAVRNNLSIPTKIEEGPIQSESSNEENKTVLGNTRHKQENTEGIQYTDTSEQPQRVRTESGLVEEQKANKSNYSEGKEKLKNNDRDITSVVDTVLTNNANPVITENKNTLPANEHDHKGREHEDQKIYTNLQSDKSKETIEIEKTSSQPDSSLEGTGQNSRNTSPRKLEVVGSDDELEPIFQGRIDASEQDVKEQSNKDLTEEEVRAKEGKGMCGHIRDERDRVRCKVIACFRDNQYCF